MLGFLPCGLIYAALLKALEAGGAWAGALTMLAFGLGTAGALAGIGVVSSLAGPRLGRWSNRVAAVAVMLFGAILLWRGLTAKPVCHG
jgi:sulfite exporter TauE/SafE